MQDHGLDPAKRHNYTGYNAWHLQELWFIGCCQLVQCSPPFEHHSCLVSTCHDPLCLARRWMRLPKLDSTRVLTTVSRVTCSSNNTPRLGLPLRFYVPHNELWKEYESLASEKQQRPASCSCAKTLAAGERARPLQAIENKYCRSACFCYVPAPIQNTRSIHQLQHEVLHHSRSCPIGPYMGSPHYLC